MAKRLKSYLVYAKTEIDSAITIRAESLEDALEKAQELKETDFVEVYGDYNDGVLSIKGVLENF